MKKRILVICPYPEDEVPGQRLKYEQYFDYLRSNGFDITVSPFFEPTFYKDLYKKGRIFKKIVGTLWGYLKRISQLFYLFRYDGIYIFLYVTPFGGASFEKMYRSLSRNMIYDIDDLVYMGKTSTQNSWVSVFRNQKKYFYLMKASNHVITCTPHLDSIVRQHNGNTTDISSTINTNKYLPINRYSNDRRLTLGWSGSHSTVPYLKILHSVLLKLRQQYDFKLLVIGTRQFEMDGIEVETIQWGQSSEVSSLQRIDVGLYPLPDEEWVLGKSGLKALQYMALGIPTVATAVGANYRVIEDTVSGYLVASEEEWCERLGNLIRDPKLRKSIGTNARERVEQKYSVQANKPVYLKIFRKVYG